MTRGGGVNFRKNIRAVNEKHKDINSQLPDAWEGISQRLKKKLGPRENYVMNYLPATFAGNGGDDESYRLLKR